MDMYNVPVVSTRPNRLAPDEHYKQMKNHEFFTNKITVAHASTRYVKCQVQFVVFSLRLLLWYNHA